MKNMKMRPMSKEVRLPIYLCTTRDSKKNWIKPLKPLKFTAKVYDNKIVEIE
jgi:hypothetical protein